MARVRNSCEIFKTEYRHSYVEKDLVPVEKFEYRDYIAERIEDGQIDPRVASIPSQIDEEAEKLVRKRILDLQRTVYRCTFKNPWDTREDEESRGKKSSEKDEDIHDYGNELLSYIGKLYFDPHEEKVLAPPATAKRIFGYTRLKFLHGGLSTYQDTYGRTGGEIMLRNVRINRTSSGHVSTKENVDKSIVEGTDFCQPLTES